LPAVDPAGSQAPAAGIVAGLLGRHRRPRAVGAAASVRFRSAESEQPPAGKGAAGRVGRLRRTERNPADGAAHAPSLLEKVLPDELKILGRLLRAVEHPDADAGQLLLAEESDLRGE